MKLHHHIQTHFFTAILAVVFLGLQSPTAAGQNNSLWLESGSYGPLPSAGVPVLPVNGVAVRPGEVAAFPDSPASCVPLVIHTREELGIPAGGNLDAWSTRWDDIPDVEGPALGGQLPAGTTCHARYSVDSASVGMLGGAVRDEAEGSDGVASDVYEGGPFDGPVGLNFFVYKDHECIHPLGSSAGETDIDAINRGRREEPVLGEYPALLAAMAAGADPSTYPEFQTSWPIFYSVDVPTAAAMGVSPADILTVSTPGGPWSVFRTAASMGLGSGDNIDGLAMEPNGRICITLTKASPMAGFAFPAPVGALGGAGVFEVLPAASPINPIPWATATQMGLLDSDEMDALAIGDPNEAPEPQHPGTDEDFVILTGVNEPVNECDTLYAGAGDILDIFVASPGGHFDWSGFVIGAQAFTNQVPTNNIPGLHLNTSGAFILVDAYTQGNGMFGSSPLLPGGNLHTFVVNNPGAQGLRLMIQAVVISPLAVNGFLATSHGHVLEFL